MMQRLARPQTALRLLFVFIFCEIAPLFLPASSGPGFPEVQSFTPAGLKEMVDPFTGDFTYNIPLLEVGGYPINLTYNSGISPNQQASWVGLGWNLNPGSINRQVRGLPDDFSGDEVQKEVNLKDDISFGAGAGISGELYGYEILQQIQLAISGGFTLGFQYNNYLGWDYTVGSSNGISAALTQGNTQLSGSLSLSSGYSRAEGNFMRPSGGLSARRSASDHSQTIGATLGMSATSRQGIQATTFGLSYSRNWNRTYRNEKNDVVTRTSFPGSLRASFPIDYLHPGYVPTYGLPRTTLSGTFSAKIGGELIGWAMAGQLSGNFSFQELKNNRRDLPAYGYLYAHQAQTEESLMDVNRENDGPFQEEAPHISVPIFTHDLYSVSAQGFQGQFRPFRSDIGILTDPKVHSDANGGSFGAEASFGNLVKAGGDITITNTQSGSGAWTSSNQAQNVFQFRENDPGNPLYEPVYFKRVGELTRMSNPQVFQNLGGFQAAYLETDNKSASANLRDPEGNDLGTLTSPQQVMRRQREARQDLMTFLDAREAGQAAIERPLYHTTGITLLSDLPNQYDLARTPLPRIDAKRKAHHLSEIRVTKDNGVRYVYGLPVYENEKVEVAFNASGLTPDQAGMIAYSPGLDNSSRNNRGNDNYFSRTVTPPHASAFLLTCILSEDYVDLTGNGPTPDDLGAYTRFSYEKVHDRYGWRMPDLGAYTATYDSAYIASTDDDRAGYIYGSREVWYLKAVETKNYIAEFHTSGRNDVRNVIDEDGLDNSEQLRKLDQIVLYSRADVVKKGPALARPIKTVHFAYDYSLADPNPGANTGKLTLKEVYFTYGNSNRGRHNPYKFFYTGNFKLLPRSTDRWGSFKVFSALNDVFPYTSTDPALADLEARAWHLNRITLPTGGEIRVEYEADDYAYVQDRKAMNMLPILGFAPGLITSQADLNDQIYSGDTPYDHLYFRMLGPASAQADVAPYLEGIRELYFRCRVKVDDTNFEEIRGFIPLNNPTFGYLPADPTVGYVVIPRFQADAQDLPSPSGKVHPVTKAAAQFLANTQPKVAYGLDDFDDDDILVFAEKVAANLAGGAFANVLDFPNFVDEFKGANRGRILNTSHSWVRLNHPTGFRPGGGSRVKKILIDDNWDYMTGKAGRGFEYGQEFTYLAEENGRLISSGVASYEPLIGGDENPHVEPARYFIEKKLAADVNEFSLLPIPQSLFPAPVVGYSKVQVKNLNHPNVERTATGRLEYQYYTARNYPTKTQVTRLDSYLEKPEFNPLNQFQHISSATASQGFYIELNNMHGQPLATLAYSELDSLNPISGTYYYYKRERTDLQQLNNKVTVIDPQTEKPTTELLGVEYEFVVDARSSSLESFSGGGELNVDVALLGPVPSTSVTGYPHFQQTKVDHRTISTLKVVQRTGILERTRTFDMGSGLDAWDLVYDGETGNVLVSGVLNEFRDTIYETNIPAHWLYEGMGQAYRNTGLQLPNQSINNGNLALAGADTLFVRGDELLLTPVSGTEPLGPGSEPGLSRDSTPSRAWVFRVRPDGLDLINSLGQPFHSGAFDLKVLRSGRRNQASAPVQSVQSMTYPAVEGGLRFDQVLNAEINTHSDYWQTYLGFLTEVPESFCICTDAPDPGDPKLPKRQAIVDFIRNHVGTGSWTNPPPAGTPLPSGYTFLGPDYDPASTVFHVVGNAGGMDIHFQDTSTWKTCTLNLSLQSSEEMPVYFTVAPAETGTLFPLSTYACDDNGKFSFEISWWDNNQIFYTASLTAYSDCISILNCHEALEEFPPLTCGIDSGDVVNPFLLGILGNWRPHETFRYRIDRNTTERARTAGPYQNFQNMSGFQPLNGVTLYPVWGEYGQGYWEKTASSSVIDPFGKELEILDGLARPSATIYGYGFHIPLATARNARYQQIAFDGFEDYDFANQTDNPLEECDLPSHWRLEPAQAPVNDGAAIGRDTLETHSGLFSLRVRNDSATIARAGADYCDPAARTPVLDAVEYKLEDCDLIRSFAPTPGDYLLTAWVRELPSSLSPVLDTAYEHSRIRVRIQSGLTTLETNLRPAGPMIEGWQRVEGIFTVPEGEPLSQIEVSFIGEDPNWNSYFDDVRIQPRQAVMSSYVYDPVSLRMLAELDAQNYGTFYEYDYQGQLVRIERETDKGIVTVREFRISSPTTTRTLNP